MRHGLSLVTVGIGWVLFTMGGCTDESTKNPSGGNGSGQTAYCQPCVGSGECAYPNVCRAVTGGPAVCAAPTDTSCCVDATQKTCHSPLGGTVDGAGGSGGGGIIGGGGKAGSGTGGTFGGSGGTGGTTNTGANLGRACVSDTDCGDARLTCLTNDGLSGNGPAKGICTAACGSTSDCLELADDAFCAQFTDSDAYCLEGCTLGVLGEPKCHSRQEMACNVYGLNPTGASCATDDDCPNGDLCSTTGTCGSPLTACLPACGGDYDCGAGQHCDFSSGLCLATEPAGLPIGSACTPPTGNETDACDGVCFEHDANDPTVGECSAWCVFNNTSFTGCGWDGTGKADAACLFGPSFEGSGQPGNGDVGICGTLCDCNSDCSFKGDYCVDDTMGAISMIWGRGGYCRPLQEGESASISLSQCPPGHTGGSGGNAGEAGQSSGGSSNSEAGAGAGGQGGS